MSGKSVRSIADNRKARFRINSQSAKDFFEGRANAERSAATREEVICKTCGFKARFKFFRCPGCDSEKQY